MPSSGRGRQAANALDEGVEKEEEITEWNDEDEWNDEEGDSHGTMS